MEEGAGLASYYVVGHAERSRTSLSLPSICIRQAEAISFRVLCTVSYVNLVLGNFNPQGNVIR